MNSFIETIILYFTNIFIATSECFLFSHNHKDIYKVILIVSFLIIRFILYYFLYRLLDLNRSVPSYMFSTVKIKNYVISSCFILSLIILSYVIDYFSWYTVGLFVKVFILINFLSFLLFYNYYKLEKVIISAITYMINIFIFLAILSAA